MPVYLIYKIHRPYMGQIGVSWVQLDTQLDIRFCLPLWWISRLEGPGYWALLWVQYGLRVASDLPGNGCRVTVASGLRCIPRRRSVITSTQPPWTSCTSG